MTDTNKCKECGDEWNKQHLRKGICVNCRLTQVVTVLRDHFAKLARNSSEEM